MQSIDSTDQFLSISSGGFTAPMADALIHFEVSDQVKARIEELAEKRNFGTITGEEHAEHLRWINLVELLSLCQAKARGFLNDGDRR